MHVPSLLLGAAIGASGALLGLLVVGWICDRKPRSLYDPWED